MFFEISIPLFEKSENHKELPTPLFIMVCLLNQWFSFFQNFPEKENIAYKAYREWIGI